MGKTTRRRYFHIGCLGVILLFSLSVRSNAQAKVDLEIKIAAPDTAQGGETFEYTVMVTNKGTATAMRVTQVNYPEQSGPFLSEISGQSSKGNCGASQYDSLRPKLRCEIGELKSGETVTITIAAKLSDFGDISKPEIRYYSDLRNLEPSKVNSVWVSKRPSHDTEKNGVSSSGQRAAQVDESASIIDAWVVSEQEEETPENNRLEIRAKVLPSKNIPPRVEVLTPKFGTAFVSPVGTKIKIPLEIKAFDPDGSIRKVTILTGFLPTLARYLEDDGTFSYIIGGQKYTPEKARQVQADAWNKLREQSEAGESPPELRANAKSKGIYEYVVTNYDYGENRMSICAFDDGGRTECIPFYFNVKSGSEIKLTKPDREVLPLNSPVLIETSSKVRPGINAKVILYGLEGRWSSPQDPLLMRQTAKGTTITHTLNWTPTNEGYYYLRAVLYENGEETNNEATFGVFVAEPRAIKITSLRNGQECTTAGECKIEVYARDTKGRTINDRFEIMLDGKEFGSIYSSDCKECAPKSRRLDSLEKGAHTIQIVAKADDHGPELGRSEVYTVFFR